MSATQVRNDTQFQSQKEAAIDMKLEVMSVALVLCSVLACTRHRLDRRIDAIVPLSAAGCGRAMRPLRFVNLLRVCAAVAMTLEQWLVLGTATQLALMLAMAIKALRNNGRVR